MKDLRFEEWVFSPEESQKARKICRDWFFFFCEPCDFLRLNGLVVWFLKI